MVYAFCCLSSQGAAHYKATEEIPKAMDLLRQVIILEKFEEKLNSGETVDVSELPPENPSVSCWL